MTEVKSVYIPEGLGGSRADAGLSKALGLSRTAVAELLDLGLVASAGRVLSKSD